MEEWMSSVNSRSVQRKMGRKNLETWGKLDTHLMREK
jgi:hypothetical protein